MSEIATLLEAKNEEDWLVMLPELSRLCSQMLAPPHVLEQVLQNKLGTALAILTKERQRVTTREAVRGPRMRDGD
jgi:hypothetical protein